MCDTGQIAVSEIEYTYSDRSHHGRNVGVSSVKEILDKDLCSIIAGPVLEVFWHAGS